MKSLGIGLVFVLTTLVIFLRLITQGADTTPTKQAIVVPIAPELFTPFAKPPTGNLVLHYRIRRIGGRRAVYHPRLPDFRPLPGYTSAISIAGNLHQQVVGHLYRVNSGAWLQIFNHGFLHSNGVMYDLGTLPGYQISNAVTINSRGVIAGYSQENSMDGGTPCHAVCWVHRKIRDLGIGRALCIDNSGNIVGDSSAGQSPSPPLWTATPEDYDAFRNSISSQALLWTRGYRYDLNDCIPPRSGWVLTSADGINNKGQIVGHGLFRGKERAFLLTPARH